MVRLARRPYAGNQATLLRGKIGDATGTCFWLRWCPTADVHELQQTVERMRWWRGRHSGLCGPVADVLDCWHDERVLVLQGCAGAPLAKCLRQWPSDGMNEAARELGRWLRDYAAGHAAYGADVEFCCGSESSRDSASGRLSVDARQLLRRRLAMADAAARRLTEAGWRLAKSWSGGVDPASVEQLATGCEPAGFVHGDLNLGNVLIAGSEFSLVDWWIAPRVSWPITDVAMLAGNLWLVGDEPHDAFWRSFATAYFGEAPCAVDAARIDLLARMMCIGLLDRKLAGGGLARLVERRWVGRTLSRLADAAPLGAIA